jgi:hypothetical protein
MKIRRLGVAAILGFSLATAGCAGVGSVLGVVGVQSMVFSCAG